MNHLLTFIILYYRIINRTFKKFQLKACLLLVETGDKAHMTRGWHFDLRLLYGRAFTYFDGRYFGSHYWSKSDCAYWADFVDYDFLF